MQELRLLGVHRDEEHLLLVAANGTKYRLAIDPALRAAIRRVPARPEHHVPKSQAAMSPREIQAHIRSGATAEDIAKAADLPLDHVQRYEGPVLAERKHICDLAGRHQIRTTPGAPQAYLSEVVTERLMARRADDHPHWDAWRLESGSWLVQLSFVSGGSERTAQWSYQPQRAHLDPLDDEARWFSHPDDDVEPPVDADPLDRVRPVSAAEAMGLDTAKDSNTPRVTAEPSFASTDALLQHLESQHGLRTSAHDPARLPDTAVAEQAAQTAGSTAEPPAAHATPHTLRAAPEPAAVADDATDDASVEDTSVATADRSSADSGAAADQTAAPAKAGSTASKAEVTVVAASSSTSQSTPGGGSTTAKPAPPKQPAAAANATSPHSEQAPVAVSPTATTSTAKTGGSDSRRPSTPAADIAAATDTSTGQADGQEVIDVAAVAAAEPAQQAPRPTKPKKGSKRSRGRADTSKADAAKNRRSKVPSWDEIMFGSRKD